MQQNSLSNGARRIAIGGLSLVLATSLMVPGLAMADPSAAELQEQADAAQERADSLGDSQQLQAQAQQALERLNGMQETLDRTAADYAEALQAQANAEAARDAAQARIDELAVEIADVQGDLSGRARSMYRTGTGSMVDLILGSETFEELATNWSILSRMNEADADLIEQEKQLKAETEEQHQIYEREATTAAAKSEEAAAAKAEAESTAAAYEAEYNSLSAQAQEALEAEREAQRLREEAEAQRVVEEAAAEAARLEAERQAAEAAAAEQAEREAQARAAAEAEDDASDDAVDDGEEATPTSAYSGDSDVTYTNETYEGGSTAVERAYSCLGLPYVWASTGPGSYDCSGLVGYCLTGSHERIGTTYTFMGWPRVSDPQPGDVCTSWSHCGIYIGDGQMIHAPQTGDVVKIGPVQSGMIIVRYPG